MAENIGLSDEVAEYLSGYLVAKRTLEEDRKKSVRATASAPNTTKNFKTELFDRLGNRALIEAKYRVLLGLEPTVNAIMWSKMCITKMEASSRAREIRLRSYKDNLVLADAESDVRLKYLEVEERNLQNEFIG